MNSPDVHEMNVRQMVEAFRERRLSPIEATRVFLERIDRIDARLNAFCHVAAEIALKQAGQSEARWANGEPLSPLDGVPTCVKDVYATRDMPTTRGSWVAAASGGDEDAPTVTAMRNAGMVLLGKTTTSEFGWKATTDSPRFGITRNPYDLSRTPGGSSGGTAVAVAAGLCVVAPGTDGAGSIRIPASFTGLVGLKPTYGSVPIYPDSPFSDVSHSGPMGRSTTDVRALFDILRRRDWRDPAWRPVTPRDPNGRGAGFGKVALLEGVGPTRADEAVRRAVRAAGIALQRAGVEVVEADLHLPGLREAFVATYSSSADLIVTAWTEADRARVDPGLLQLAALAAQGVDRHVFQRGLMLRREAAREVNRLLETCSALLMPTVPRTAFEAGHDVPPGSELSLWFDWSPNTYPFNATGHPACSVPVGHDQFSLPIGAQLVGRPGNEFDLLDLAEIIEVTLRPTLLSHHHPPTSASS